uniref:Uncharacterized protein n=1 Tax=Anguilla anguilla TaxID=7936 RepID=A0A0E9Q998_ANGAN
MCILFSYHILSNNEISRPKPQTFQSKCVCLYVCQTAWRKYFTLLN